MSVAQPRLQDLWLHRFALVVAGMTVALITAGALVTSTQSGDAIPDWPTSYGALVPSYLAGGVLIEWAHRLIAGITALLVGALAIWLAFSSQPRRVKLLGGVAVLAIVLQAVLGGLRVLVVSHEQVQATTLSLLGLPHTVAARLLFAVAHATLAQVVLCLVFAIAFLTHPAGFHVPSASTRLKLLAGGIVVLLFVQLLLGALMRHSNAGLIIPDFPTSFGKLLPPFGNLPFDPNNPQRMSYGEFAFKVALHFAHRLNGFLIALAIAGLFWLARQMEISLLRSVTAWQLGLVLWQIILGAFVIWTQLSVPVTVAHVAVGATLLGISVIVFLSSCLCVTMERGER